MFNPVTATFVVAIGVFAGSMFDTDKKYHEMVWVGIFLVVFTPIIIGGRYGFNWGFAGLIEIIAGLGLYKMFFHKMFESSYALGQQRERYYQKESTRESVDRLEDKLEKPENERKEWINLLKKNNPEKQKNELIDKLSPQVKSMLFFLILVVIIFIVMILSFPNY